jgi:hypothetical protein
MPQEIGRTEAVGVLAALGAIRSIRVIRDPVYPVVNLTPEVWGELAFGAKLLSPT